MSKDAWLHALRSDPSPVFKEQLRARLRAQEPASLDSARPSTALGSGQEAASDPRHDWPRHALVAAAAVVAAAVLISVPGVRASVAQFVSLFRVVHVVAVPVDSNRLDRLQTENLEIGTLIGEHVEVLQDPGPPVNVASLDQAATTAGMTLALPQWLPQNTQIIEMAVVGERVVRVTASGQRLQQVMDALGINDLMVPAGLDGQIVNVRVPPVVMIRYDHGGRRSRLFQARAPQLTLPNSIDVRALGEIGLRILGLAPVEAKQFAQTIDWHSTLVMPVPPNATSFRQVSIGGHQGVVIQHQPRDQSPTNTVVWSTPDRVLALVSIHGWEQVLEMANSVR
jgi:hypothetical protein